MHSLNEGNAKYLCIYLQQCISDILIIRILRRSQALCKNTVLHKAFPLPWPYMNNKDLGNDR